MGYIQNLFTKIVLLDTSQHFSSHFWHPKKTILLIKFEHRPFYSKKKIFIKGLFYLISLTCNHQR